MSSYIIYGVLSLHRGPLIGQLKDGHAVILPDGRKVSLNSHGAYMKFLMPCLCVFVRSYIIAIIRVCYLAD